MKPFNYVFIAVVGILFISSAAAVFFVGGYTPKIISSIIAAIAVSMIINSIRSKLFVKKEEKDERDIAIDDRAKAKAFDVMGIVFGILIIIYTFMKYNLLIVLLACAAYLLIFIVYMFYFGKYHKEMWRVVYCCYLPLFS